VTEETPGMVMIEKEGGDEVRLLGWSLQVCRTLPDARSDIEAATVAGLLTDAEMILGLVESIEAEKKVARQYEESTAGHIEESEVLLGEVNVAVVQRRNIVDVATGAAVPVILQSDALGDIRTTVAVVVEAVALRLSTLFEGDVKDVTGENSLLWFIELGIKWSSRKVVVEDALNGSLLRSLRYIGVGCMEN